MNRIDKPLSNVHILLSVARWGNLSWRFGRHSSLSGQANFNLHWLADTDMFLSSKTQFGRHFSLSSHSFNFCRNSRRNQLKCSLAGTLHGVARQIWFAICGGQRQFKHLKGSLPGINCCWQAHVQHLCTINVKYHYFSKKCLPAPLGAWNKGFPGFPFYWHVVVRSRSPKVYLLWKKFYVNSLCCQLFWCPHCNFNKPPFQNRWSQTLV